MLVIRMNADPDVEATAMGLKLTDPVSLLFTHSSVNNAHTLLEHSSLSLESKFPFDPRLVITLLVSTRLFSS